MNQTNQNADEFNWKSCIWTIKAPPKLKIFLWRLNSKALPVGVNLVRRGIADATSCKRCTETEDKLHVLLKCTLAVRVWNLAPILFPPDTHNITSLNQLFIEVQRQINLPPIGVSVPLYPWILWQIWSACNLFIFENRSITAEEIMRKAVVEAKLWQNAQFEVQVSRRTTSPQVGSALLLHSTLCYVDASWLPESLDCGMGFCFVNTYGDVISEASISQQKVPSALVAEALAIKAALIAALNAGFRNLSCSSDSLSLVTLLNTQEVVNELKTTLHDIRCISIGFENLSFTFIPRLENSFADNLAKIGLVTLNTVLT